MFFSKKAKHLREQQQEEDRRVAEEQRKQEEYRKVTEYLKKQEQGDDKKYDRIINCPYCKGTGEFYAALTELRLEGLPPKQLFFIFDPVLDQKKCQHWIKELIVSAGYDQRLLSVTYFECLFCKGDGIAYAWFEQIQDALENCIECNGAGEVTVRVKAKVGMETKKITCTACQGTGLSHISHMTIVHIKTLAGGFYGQIDEYELFKIDESVRYQTIHLTDNPTDNDYPYKCCIKIDDNNRQVFAESKLRFAIN
ncbi:hypothetical protein U27_06581 [Candidatus Vecturithrix granuli]|uniref:Uncharacterized protein n=1 Tax=Vecturithrix granuli TaxID=1499967 RepID=A0A081C4U1_VECG1|nr:hypothetical protein U27_06581 [Candidatus Vecturithrix granuli]